MMSEQELRTAEMVAVTGLAVDQLKQASALEAEIERLTKALVEAQQKLAPLEAENNALRARLTAVALVIRP